MKKRTIFTALFSLLGMSLLFGQAIVQNDTVYYPEIHPIEYDQLVYKTAPQIDELTPVINENLALRVYYPTDLEPGEIRPLVVLVHGGGFIGGTYTSFFNQAEMLAQLGFVAVSVQYRLCKRGDCLLAAGLSYPCNVSWANSLIPSAYVAAVDVADAITWLKNNAANYHIDPDNIAVGGHSAGGWTSLHLAFMDMDEANEICPSCGTWPDYLEETLETPDGIKAVFNMSGALIDTTWIDPDESDINLMNIHGTHDGIVSYESDPVYPCCNTYSVEIDGSCPISTRQQNLDGNSYLFTGFGYGHDVFVGEYGEENGTQILWFLGKSFFDESPFQKHSVVNRDIPLITCPTPFPPVAAGQTCGLSQSPKGIVLLEEPPIISSATEIATNHYVSIYPNPASDLLTIDVRLSAKAGIGGQGKLLPYELSLFNSTGQLVLQKIIYAIPENTLIEQIRIDHLPGGIYFARMRTEQQIFYQESVIID
ncbi:MAG: alpha/beta fold hydrolase [Bacteroidetes bacterium]|nr:alpha/beta fold hydrolase [Bacteroidota bacterium]